MGRLNLHDTRYKNVGRKTKIIPEVLKKLEEAAALDASVEEMCFYAEISTTTYYNYCGKNPEFLDRIAELKQKPILKARSEVIKGLDNDKYFSFSYLKSKKPKEFTTESVKVEHSGNIANDDLTHAEDEALRLEFKEKLKENIKKRAVEKAQLKKNGQDI